MTTDLALVHAILEETTTASTSEHSVAVHVEVGSRELLSATRTRFSLGGIGRRRRHSRDWGRGRRRSAGGGYGGGRGGNSDNRGLRQRCGSRSSYNRGGDGVEAEYTTIGVAGGVEPKAAICWRAGDAVAYSPGSLGTER
jgi:hypothetical protein